MSTAVASIAARPAVPDDGETFDVTVTKLKLVGALRAGGIDPKGIDVDITKTIADGHVEDSTTGAPQLVINVLDRDYAALQSGVFGQKVDIEIDSIPYRLVEVSVTQVEALELTFEHKLVNLLRQQRGPLKAARSTVTRAKFFEMMLREIAPAFPVRYVCPEENVIQPVGASTKTSGRTLTAKTIGTHAPTHAVRQPGFGASSLQIRNWDGGTVTLGPAQLANAAIVLQVCKQLGASPKATLAVVAACIVEPDVPFGNPPVEPGSGGSAGILQWGGGGTSLPSWATDVAQAVTHSLQDPGATGAGGMMSLAQRNPGWTPGQIAQREQGSAFPARYDQAVPGAQTVISAFGGGGGGLSGTIDVTFAGSGVSTAPAAATQYEFSRGQPGQPEDSWTCMQRLAKEVNWRVFVAGRNSLYFVTDDDLLKSEPIYTIRPNTKGAPKVTFDTEVGGRTVKVHRHRQPKPSEADLTVRIDRWDAAPGSVIILDRWGPADGRWIVVDCARPLFDTEATVHLQSPQASFPEPAAAATATAAGSATLGEPTFGGLTITATQSGLTGSAIDRVYAAAQAIDARNLPYVYGGGHGSWADAASSNGLDCSSSTSLALYQAGLMHGFASPIVSGDFAGWGLPGTGRQMTVWYNAGHVFIQFYGRPAKRFDTVPGGSGGDGPHLRYTAPGDPSDTWEASGFQARHYPGL